MKKTLTISAVMLLILAGPVVGSQIGDLVWNRANIETLRSFDKTTTLRFLNEQGGVEGTPAALTDKEIDEFEWIDLAGNGRYQLALVGSSGPCCEDLLLYWQDAPGKLRFQSFDGAGKLSETIRDINGDGMDELIIWKEVAAPGSWSPMTATPRWPAVYKFKDGKYVEASGDFPNFYDTEVLPKLETEIGKASNPDNAATLTLQRDKVLRVLGRDPTAGIKQAYEWMSSGDSQLLQCAIATFADIGGHEQELRAAKQALKPAIQRELADRHGG
jgi:hypothetical protein